jgi:hypothetical protein
MRYFTLAAIALVALSVAVVVAIVLTSNNSDSSTTSDEAVVQPSLSMPPPLSPSPAPEQPAEINNPTATTTSPAGETMSDSVTSVTIFGQIWDIATSNVVFLEDMDLMGTIPTEVGLFTNLFNLHLRINPLVGPIPSEIGQLQKLNFMNIGGNPSLYGTVPTELGRLTALEWLGLWDSSYVGTIPTVLGQLTAALDVGRPQFAIKPTIWYHSNRSRAARPREIIVAVWQRCPRGDRALRVTGSDSPG